MPDAPFAKITHISGKRRPSACCMPASPDSHHGSDRSIKMVAQLPPLFDVDRFNANSSGVAKFVYSCRARSLAAVRCLPVRQPRHYERIRFLLRRLLHF